MVKIISQRETETDYIVMMENENGNTTEIMIPKETCEDVYSAWNQPYVIGLNMITEGHYS